MPLIDLANPTRFLAYSGRILPWVAGLAAIGLIVGLYLSFFVAPPDYQQGEMVRVMFIHVPVAWLSMACFGLMAVASLGTLVWRHPLADVAAKSIAPLGAAFTFLALVTGSIWGKPTWGTWWVWDARLTSELILLLMYLGLIALRQTVDDPGKVARAAAILTLVGVVNLPIIKFSVECWNTLHQPDSILRLSPGITSAACSLFGLKPLPRHVAQLSDQGPSIDPAILRPLLVMIVAMTLLFVTLMIMAMRNEILRRRVRSLELAAASA